jgi:hypothetical protein
MRISRSVYRQAASCWLTRAYHHANTPLSYQVAKLSEEMPVFLGCLFIILKDLS